MGYLDKFPLPKAVLALVPADYAWDPRAKPDDTVEVADVPASAIAWNPADHQATRDLYNQEVKRTLEGFTAGTSTISQSEADRTLLRWLSS